MHLKKQSRTIHKLLLASLFIGTLTAAYYSQSKTGVSESPKFSVVSIRVMNGDEALARTPHSLNADVVVRLRLSNDSNKGIFFLTYEDTFRPLGLIIKQTDKGIIWLYGKEGKSETSPGIEKAFAGLPLKWLILPPHTAIEWEMFDSTLYENQRHAFTMFTKEKETDEPLEAFSDFYAVPTKEQPKEK